MFFSRLQHSGMAREAVYIAYSITLALFPILLSIAALLPLLRIDPAIRLLPYLDSVIPQPIVAALEPTITELLGNPNGGALSLGIVVTIITASRGVSAIRAGIDSAYGLRKTRMYITSRVLSVLSYIAVLVLLLALMLAFGLGEPLLQSLLRFVGSDADVLGSFRLLRGIVAFASMFLVFWLLYRIAPSVRQRLRDAAPGALFATACLSVLVQLYALYLRVASRSLSAYGLISAIFVLLIWLRLLASVILLGALLNATRYEMRYGTPAKRESPADNLLRSATDRLLRRVFGKLWPQPPPPKEPPEHMAAQPPDAQD